MNNIVILKTVNGIGDKIINLFGASVYCYYKNYNLNIILNENIYNYYFGSNNFYDLSLFDFNNINVYNHINDLYNTKGIIELFQFHNPDTILHITPYCVYEKLKNEGIDVSFEEVSNMFIKISKNIKPSNLILKYIPDNIKNSYGIHLRSTDKIKNNPDIRHEMSYNEHEILLNKLLITIENIIENEDEPCFFITSENKEHKYCFIEKIQNIAVNKNKLVKFLNIDENIDIKIKSIPNFDSILDLFSLSKCKNIIQGVRYSAFSIVASLIGNEKIINFSKYLESDHLCITYLWNSVININNTINFDKNMYINLINKYKELGFYGDIYISKYN